MLVLDNLVIWKYCILKVKVLFRPYLLYSIDDVTVILKYNVLRIRCTSISLIVDDLSRDCRELGYDNINKIRTNPYCSVNTFLQLICTRILLPRVL